MPNPFSPHVTTDMAEDRHLRIHPRCLLCGFRFNMDDPVYALSRGAFAKLDFPNSYHCDNEHGHPWAFCRIPNCKRCQLSPVSGTVHTSCLKLFMSNNTDGVKPAFQYLQVAATQQSPWRGTFPLYMEPSIRYRCGPLELLCQSPVMPTHAKTPTAKAPGCGQIRSPNESPSLLYLPEEIRAMIWQHCFSSPVCQYSSVMNLLDDMESASQRKPSSVSLRDIEYWSRGYEVQYSDRLNTRHIRLTFDHRGLERIESHKARPPRDVAGSNSYAFVVACAESFADVYVQFQLGMAQLVLPSTTAQFHIWDTPNPPPLKRCFSPESPQPRSCYIGTINLQACTGLTFFVSAGSTYAVHAHTESRPSAQLTYESLSAKHQKQVFWLYVPVNGRITRFGFSQLPYRAGNFKKSQTFLLSMQFGRDRLIGQHRERFSISYEPDLLLYERAPDALPISFIGAYSKDESQTLRDVSIPRSAHYPWKGHAACSSVSLQHVTQINIFRIGKTNVCRGLIVANRLGLRSALGECRLGRDPVEKHTCPRYLCFRATTYNELGVDQEQTGFIVVCTESNNHSHHSAAWTCCEMRGILSLQTDGRRAKLEYTNMDE